eukprot:scaffold168227_cov18-Tisochrysis_lutea.AAC.1
MRSAQETWTPGTSLCSAKDSAAAAAAAAAATGTAAAGTGACNQLCPCPQHLEHQLQSRKPSDEHQQQLRVPVPRVPGLGPVPRVSWWPG